MMTMTVVIMKAFMHGLWNPVKIKEGSIQSKGLPIDEQFSVS